MHDKSIRSWTISTLPQSEPLTRIYAKSRAKKGKKEKKYSPVSKMMPRKEMKPLPIGLGAGLSR